MAPSASLWPLAGFLWLVRRPGLWLRPVAGLLLLGAGAVGGGVLAGWLLWPSATASWAAWLGQAGLALGGGLAIALGLAAVLTPLLMALFLDEVALRVRQEAVAPPVATTALTGLAAAGVVLGRTLPERLGWMAVAFLGGFTGPGAVVIAAYAWSRIAAADAFDTALAAEGASVAERLAARRDHRQELRLGGLCAAALQLGLAFLVVAWLWWMPALVAGAALRRLARDTAPR